MAKVELIMPKLGESIIEATILSWDKKIGDSIAQDENVLTIATAKVDTEVPSPVAGILTEIFFSKDSVVPVGKAIAIIETESDAEVKVSPAVAESKKEEQNQQLTPATDTAQIVAETSGSDRFYSPLVKSIAKAEGLSFAVLDTIQGTGQNGRLTKTDLLQFISQKQSSKPAQGQVVGQIQNTITYNSPQIDASGNVEIIEMDRMRKLIAEHMVMSKHVSPHVTSFVECDGTHLVL